jgi:hypothetical protein
MIEHPPPLCPQCFATVRLRGVPHSGLAPHRVRDITLLRGMHGSLEWEYRKENMGYEGMLLHYISPRLAEAAYPVLSAPSEWQSAVRKDLSLGSPCARTACACHTCRIGAPASAREGFLSFYRGTE